MCTGVKSWLKIGKMPMGMHTKTVEKIEKLSICVKLYKLPSK